MRLPTLLLVLAAAVSNPTLPGQSASRPGGGQNPGTERWNVTFQKRSFDLGAFRAAIANQDPPARVAAIVADLEQRARQDQGPFAEAVAAAGGRVLHHFWLINAATIELPRGQVDRVRRMPNILFVRPDLVTTPAALPPIKTATNATHHRTDGEQSRGNRGWALSTVAILDSSQDDSRHGTGKPHRVYYVDGDRTDRSGRGLDRSRLMGNFRIGSRPANNPVPHGTGVASVAAGGGWGTAGADEGQASRAQIVGYSIADFADGRTYLSTQAKAWQRVAADRARFIITVANMSYHSSPDPTNVSQQALDSCARNADVLAVVCAGNKGASTASSGSACNGLAVGAAGGSKTMLASSSRGPITGDPKRFYPDIVAHGKDVVMARYGSESANWVASGTSFAAPQVAGAAQLVRNAGAVLGALDLKAILLCSTEDISAKNPTYGRNAYGLGYLRVDRACAVARGGFSTKFAGNITAANNPKRYFFSATKGEAVAISIAWHRYVFTSKTWSNLDLEVKLGPTLVASSRSERNLYEVARFQAAASGTYTIEVRAKSLEVGAVKFAGAICKVTGGVTGDYSYYGIGCRGTGSGSVPLLAAAGVPLIGRAFELGLSGAKPSSAATVLFGASRTSWLTIPLPLDLGPFGATGCKVLASGEMMLVVPIGADGKAKLTATLPNDTRLAGGRFYNQVLVFDPAANALGLVTTRGGAAKIGRLP